MSTRVLVLGRSGQLATELMRASLPTGFSLEAMGRDAFDLADVAGIADKLRAARPDVVINAAGFTAVDQAETHVEEAFALNRDAPAALARACAGLGAALVHVSTDYVFDGAKTAAYVETDPKAPINVYGRSKSEGEDAVSASGARAAVVRTSWVFASHGANFVRTMLRLAEGRDEVSVVADQIGRPTWAKDLADACLVIAQRLAAKEDAARGVFHLGGADDTSWAGFAEEIFAQSGETTRVKHITTAEFGAPAPRPLNSRLDTSKIEAAFGLKPRPWREALRGCLAELSG